MSPDPVAATGPAKLDVELDRQGRHLGALRVPWSHDESGYGQIVVPLAVLVGSAPGPTALLTAGVHGDEHEGRLALLRLTRELEPASLRGRVVLIPTMNPPAARVARRTSPIDGGNLARLFPGDPRGSPTSQIADGVTRLLLPHADFVLDFHSGGRTLEYLPCAWGRLPADQHAAERVLGALLAFRAPLAAAVARPEALGTFVAAALAAGKTAIATELGGAGAVTPETLSIALRGARRILADLGVVPSDQSEPVEESRLLAVLPEHFVRSPGSGLFEPAFRLGQVVAAGDPVGWLHDPERLDRSPEMVHFPSAGLVLCRRVSAVVEAGDVLAHLAAETSRDALLGLAGGGRSRLT